MEFDRPKITSFPITNSNNSPPDLIDTSNDILSNYTSFLDSQRAKYSNLLENTPAHNGSDDDNNNNAVVSRPSAVAAAGALPLPPAPPVSPAHPAAAVDVDDDYDVYDLKLSLFKKLKRNASIENFSLAAVQPYNKRFKLPFNLLQRDSMLEKSRKVNGPKFRRFKRTAQTSNTINFAPRQQKRSTRTENLPLPQSSSSSNKRLKLIEKRDSMLEKSFLINGPRYPRYNKTKQQPQPQQQQQQQQNNNNKTTNM